VRVDPADERRKSALGVRREKAALSSGCIYLRRFVLGWKKLGLEQRLGSCIVIMRTIL
jgi:hypothetical protein